MLVRDAMSTVILTLGPAFIGTGFAPVLIGMLNDLFAHQYGALGIRYSLAIVSLFAALAAITALLSTLWIREDHRRIHGVDHPRLRTQAPPAA